MTNSITIKKLEKYCSLSERCKLDVIKKLNDLKIYVDQNQIIDHLIEKNYINEERYTLLYCKSKFNLKKWGKIKINYQLKKKGIAENIINSSLDTISEETYLKSINKLINKKSESIDEKNIYKKNTKIARYLYQKGYEIDLIWKIINTNL
jgi:regulatory protein